MKNKQYWFKRRRYGYGFTPVTWQGVMITLGFVLTMILSSIILLKDVPKNTYQSEVGWFYLIMVVSIVVLLAITYKTGPKPQWRWGSKPDDNPETDF